MKAIGVLFTDAAKTGTNQPFESRKFSRVHAVFANKSEEQGVKAFFANYQEYENGKLKQCWHRHNGRWKKITNQPVDVIYSRFAASIYRLNKKNKIAERFKYKMAEQISMVNHPILDEFCWDKKLIAEMLPRHTPKTFLVNTKKGLKIVLPEIKTKKIVIKPRYGTLGKNVIITDKDKLPDKIERNTIVQEFIDTSHGIKYVTKSLHDMRLLIINGKIDHAHIRIPKKGSLTANVALGGKKIFISRIPKKARILAKRVDRLFKDFHPRVYSIDFLFNKKGKPYIVECNSQPMIDKYAFGKYAKITFYNRIIKAIKTGIKSEITKTVE